MIPKIPATEKDFTRDLKTFEHLAPKVQEVELLKDQAEKTTGPEATALQQKIRDKTKEGSTG